ncbi:hypothetical protein DOTSEDRAFT_44557 [Dothistroma septosporum NZE10]|uniref:Uncharacterized protein n=1 Tax=Dothistroma septosporum (strain NZE10 / CBS 128990) TaxID=675120 RepID=N1PPJ4_DOTSN|nr:hypothetical protein DOTSEDRAFT_44557 [Dothistroma septosporum NZE10]
MTLPVWYASDVKPFWRSSLLAASTPTAVRMASSGRVHASCNRSRSRLLTESSKITESDSSISRTASTSPRRAVTPFILGSGASYRECHCARAARNSTQLQAQSSTMGPWALVGTPPSSFTKDIKHAETHPGRYACGCA